MTDQAAKQIADTVLEAINDRDKTHIEELCDQHVQLRMPPAQVFYGVDGLREFFDTLETLLPELTMTANRIYSGDDYAVVEYDTRFRTRPSTEAEGMGVMVLQLNGDRIRRVQLYHDTAQWELVNREAV